MLLVRVLDYNGGGAGGRVLTQCSVQETSKLQRRVFLRSKCDFVVVDTCNLVSPSPLCIISILLEFTMVADQLLAFLVYQKTLSVKY